MTKAKPKLRAKDLPDNIPWQKTGRPKKDFGYVDFPIDKLRSTDSPYVQDMFIDTDSGEMRIGQIVRVTCPKGWRAIHAPTNAIVLKAAKEKDTAVVGLRTYHHLWAKDPRQVWTFHCGNCNSKPPRAEPHYKRVCEACLDVVGCHRCMPDGICAACAEKLAGRS